MKLPTMRAKHRQTGEVYTINVADFAKGPWERADEPEAAVAAKAEPKSDKAETDETAAKAESKKPVKAGKAAKK